ncbi:hypothetical protein [Dendronalium phyllosphericum]|nr:hypothetical protein [Dendronalium phyllosphericum]
MSTLPEVYLGIWEFDVRSLVSLQSKGERSPLQHHHSTQRDEAQQ